MRGILRSFKRWYFKLLRILFYSSDSKHKLALGGAIGCFWGLTPTVGLQITILTLTYASLYFINKISANRLKFLEFNLPIAIALTWVSNPLNAPILYFSWYAIGIFCLGSETGLSFNDFMTMLQPLLEVNSMLGSLDQLGKYFEDFKIVLKLLGTNILYPLILGCLITTTPIAVGFYMFLRWFLEHSKFAKSRRVK